MPPLSIERIRSRARGTIALGALLFAASTARGQLPSGLVQRRIAAIEVTGETSGATGAQDLGIPIGAPLTRALLRTTVQRLLSTGRWADVQIEAVPQGQDVLLIVELRPRIVLTRVDVDGNAVLGDDEVRQALELRAGSTLEVDRLDELARTVAATYDERGYPDAQVTLSLRDTDDPSRKVLQVAVVEGTERRVVRYAFQPDRPPAALDLEASLGVGTGAVLDRIRLREGLAEAANALRRGGYLESELGEPEVRATGSSALVVVPLSLGPHYEIRIVGHEPLSRETIEAALQLDRERLSRAGLDALRTRVHDVMLRHGFQDAEVEVARVRTPRPSELVLEVRIEPGRQLAVIGHSFPGATHFGSDYLRDQLISVLEEELPDTRLFTPVDSDTADRLGLSGRSVLATRRVPPPLEVDPARVFYPPLYDQAVEHLQELYQAAGYLAARAGPAELRSVGRGRAIVIVPVVEGPRTLLYGVVLRGNRLITERELLEAAQLARGEPFSHLALEEALERMTELYRERGHYYARIDASVRYSEDRERAEVVLRAIERYPVRVGDVEIEGARHTSHDVIRDVLRFGPGDLLRPSSLRASQDALMALGIFTSVTVGPRDADLPERVKPVVVTVRERQAQYLDFEAGISTGQGVRGALEWGWHNPTGHAFTITARAQAGFQFFFQDDELRRNITPLPLESRLERRIALTLSLPYLPTLDNVRTSLDLVHLRDNERAFGLTKNGVILSFNWRPYRILTLTWSNEFEQNEVQLFGNRQSIREILEMSMGDPRLNRLLRVPEGESLVVSSRISGALDQRDNPFVPTRGWFTSASVEWVRTLDTATQDDGTTPFFSHFLKLTAGLNGYLPIGDFVIAGQLRAGGIAHLQSSSRTYPNRQFFLGGVDTLRGFNQDQLQPQDIADFQIANPSARTGTVLQGGDFFYLLRIELRFPIFESLQGGVFADLGNHWADPSSIRLNDDFVRPTAGLGLRIVTPVGPLALDYGFNLLRRDVLNEPIGAFHFSIGVF